MSSCGLREVQNNPRFCSIECRKKHNHENQRSYRQSLKHNGLYDRRNHIDRAKHFGVDYEPGITLKKLIKRDGMRCAICGKPCNYDDHGWTEYFGPTYPTIDYIVPLSKGGTHTWDNVQVAHAICNSEKSNKIVRKETINE